MSALVLRKDNMVATKVASHESRVTSHDYIKTLIKQKMDADAFNAWILPLNVSETAGKTTLVAASRFNADFIRATYGHILETISHETGAEIELSVSPVKLRVIETPANINAKQGADKNAADASAAIVHGFDDFISSEANQFALSAVKKCVAGTVSFSPLVIYGPTGSGKSMLLDLLSKNTRARIVHTTGAVFVSDFVRSMKDNTVFAWKDAMRGCDIFIMDDIQGLAGKRASAEEFMSLLSDLMRDKKTVVLSSNIAPDRITGFDRRLVSILASGLSVDLTAPSIDVREKILLTSGIAQKDAHDIAARAPANGHVLSGIVKKISAWRELSCGELSAPVLERLLGDVLSKQNSPTKMVKDCCAKLGVAFDDVMSTTRTRRVVFARQKIMAALKGATNLTLAEIGRLVGDRDHASVLYAISQIDKAKETDMLLASEITDLIK